MQDSAGASQGSLQTPELIFNMAKGCVSNIRIGTDEMSAWRIYTDKGVERYLEDYSRVWQWSWNHLVDPVHGA